MVMSIAMLDYQRVLMQQLLSLERFSCSRNFGMISCYCKSVGFVNLLAPATSRYMTHKTWERTLRTVQWLVAASSSYIYIYIDITWYYTHRYLYLCTHIKRVNHPVSDQTKRLSSSHDLWSRGHTRLHPVTPPCLVVLLCMFCLFQ